MSVLIRVDWADAETEDLERRLLMEASHSIERMLRDLGFDSGGNWRSKNASDIPQIGQTDQQWIDFVDEVIRPYKDFCKRFGFTAPKSGKLQEYRTKTLGSLARQIVKLTSTDV